MRIVILGSTGFVGSALADYYVTSGIETILLSRKEIDFCEEKTFNNFLLEDGDIIIDCIARIDGTDGELERTNCDGFGKFIEHVSSLNKMIKYIYFSTYATLLPEIFVINSYVDSKRKAEKIMRESGLDYKIIRLIFPFGKGESPNRLISRLINKVKNNELITIDKLTLDLTPLNMLVAEFPSLLINGKKEINFSIEISFYLPDLVSFIYKELNKKPNFIISEKNQKISNHSGKTIVENEQVVFDELKRMIHGK